MIYCHTYHEAKMTVIHMLSGDNYISHIYIYPQKENEKIWYIVDHDDFEQEDYDILDEAERRIRND